MVNYIEINMCYYPLVLNYFFTFFAYELYPILVYFFILLFLIISFENIKIKISVGDMPIRGPLHCAPAFLDTACMFYIHDIFKLLVFLCLCTFLFLIHVLAF